MSTRLTGHQLPSYSRETLEPREITLLEYLVKLAVDGDALHEFIADPTRATTILRQETREILFSRDESKIYLAVVASKPAD